jgi:hypothetical protein
VSDVDFMSHTGVMNKTQVTVLYGGIVLLHSWRIARNPAYSNFFARPSGRGFDVGFTKSY